MKKIRMTDDLGFLNGFGLSFFSLLGYVIFGIAVPITLVIIFQQFI